MKGFWRLYRKELRFLAVPGIVMIIYWVARRFLGDSLNYFSPDFYKHNIVWVPTDSTFVVKYIVRPFIYGVSRAREYIYVAMFLYAILHEHVTQSRHQLFMLPAKRSVHLTAKASAVVTWAIVSVPVLFMWRQVYQMLNMYVPGFAQHSEMFTPIEEMFFGVFAWGVTLLPYLSIATLAYVAALSVRRYPYLTGAVVACVGYVFTVGISMPFLEFIERTLPMRQGVAHMYQAQVWAMFGFQLLLAFVFYAGSLFLYERYAEV